MNLSSRAAAHRRITWPEGGGSGRSLLRSGKCAHAPASVIQPLYERAERREADDAQRAWIDDDPLVHIEVQTKAIGQQRLDHFAVRADQVPALRAEFLVPRADRRDNPALHVCQRLSAIAGEGHGARVRLNDPPQRLLRQLAPRLAPPAPAP